MNTIWKISTRGDRDGLAHIQLCRFYLVSSFLRIFVCTFPEIELNHIL